MLMTHALRLPTIAAVILLAAPGLPQTGSTRQAWGNAYLRQEASWYSSSEARAVASSVILYQSAEGGWPKGTDLARPPRSPKDVPKAGDGRANTLDNDATTLPLQFLARIAHATGEEAFRASFLRGLDYLLASQYLNGGFPQFYPLRGNEYYSRITYNDGAMIRALNVLRDVASGQAPYAFVDEERRAKAADAVKRGLDCILKTQIIEGGNRTVWCAQHDEKTLAPAWARAYEPPSFSGNESVGIVNFLMAVENPSPEIVSAIEGAVAWFKSAAMTGVRVDRLTGAEGRIERRLVSDPTAPRIWARFYELGTRRPLYLDRDSVFRYNYAEIGYERRSGYEYHGTWAERLLTRDYPAWRARTTSQPREPHVALGGDSSETAPIPRPDAVVAADGSGQYTSLQEAISKAPMRTGLFDPRWVIFVKKGVYKERVYVQRERGNILVLGEDAPTTVITFDLHAEMKGPDDKPIGTFRTPTVQIDADDMIWENLTIANGAGEPGPRPVGPPVAQALALRVDGDRVIFRRCRFLGFQDTVLVNRGRHYFLDSYIEGHVDFIFGAATAYFDRCHIHVLKSGYITAASTPEGTPHGFVFRDCRITGIAGAKTYLGRPWRSYAKTVFLRTDMSDVVRPEGWHNWNKPEAEKTTLYAEFGSTGAGASPQTRVPWASALSQAEALALTPEKVLAGNDGWNPKR